MARVGIYRDNISNESFTLHVPAYLATCIQSPQLMNLYLIRNKGDRFELAFRRLFHMRYNLTSNNWNQLGLSFLDNCDIPFPPQHFNESLPFPKISDKGSRDQEIAQNCLRDINNGVSISNSLFHPDCIVTLCSEMQIGRYYQPFEMSKSADAMVRCGELDLICFQFKNYQEPYKKSKFIEEMRKCIVPGWNVNVVLVYSSGYNDDNNNENVNDDSLISYPDIVELKDMKGILLSSTSVNEFFEENSMSKLSSSSMYDNERKEQV